MNGFIHNSLSQCFKDTGFEPLGKLVPQVSVFFVDAGQKGIYACSRNLPKNHAHILLDHGVRECGIEASDRLAESPMGYHLGTSEPGCGSSVHTIGRDLEQSKKTCLGL